MISDNSATNSSINRKKVLVVDDSALMRRVVCDIIGKDSESASFNRLHDKNLFAVLFGNFIAFS